MTTLSSRSDQESASGSSTWRPRQKEAQVSRTRRRDGRPSGAIQLRAVSQHSAAVASNRARHGVRRRGSTNALRGGSSTRQPSVLRGPAGWRSCPPPLPRRSSSSRSGVDAPRASGGSPLQVEVHERQLAVTGAIRRLSAVSVADWRIEQWISPSSPSSTSCPGTSSLEVFGVFRIRRVRGFVVRTMSMIGTLRQTKERQLYRKRQARDARSPATASSPAGTRQEPRSPSRNRRRRRPPSSGGSSRGRLIMPASDHASVRQSMPFMP